MQKIVKLSRFLKWCALITCILLPIGEAGYWITEGYPSLSFIGSWASLPQYGDNLLVWKDLDGIQRFLGFLVNLLPIAFSIASLVYLAKLFNSFQHKHLFERKNVLNVKRAGWMLIGGQLVHPLYEAMLSLTLTYRNAPGARMLSISIGNTQLEVILIGIAVLLIANILDQAAKLQEEQDSTI